jgi:hypothetical protein
MAYRDNKLGTLIVLAALAFTFTTPYSAIAQGINSLPDGPVACDAFQRSGHGAWTVLRQATLYPNGVPLMLAPGQTFAPNQTFSGFEVTAILDRNCGNR